MPVLTKEDIKNNVVANFRFVRSQFGITKKEMAKHLDINEKTYSAIEEGRANTPEHVFKLSRLINVRMDTIYTTLLNE